MEASIGSQDQQRRRKRFQGGGCGRQNSNDAPSPKISVPCLLGQMLISVLFRKDFTEMIHVPSQWTLIEILSVGLTPTGKPLKADNFLQKVAEEEVREIGSMRTTDVIGFEDVGGWGSCKDRREASRS